MTARVAVVGARGRVGRALVGHLGERWTVVPIDRQPGESVDELAKRAASSADVIVNAAGVAHAEKETPEEVMRLWAGNVELPLALADAALQAGLSLVHISSVKAVPDSPTAYGRSKFVGERSLTHDLGDRFEAGGLRLVIVRPPALLFPPFDAGKVSKLRFLRWWPASLTPPLRLPVMAPSTFLSTIDQLVARVHQHELDEGITLNEFAASQRGSLRDVRSAFAAAT